MDPRRRVSAGHRLGADGLACRPGSVPGPSAGPRGRPSIYEGRCRHPPAIYPRTRAGSPRTCARPAPRAAGFLTLLQVGSAEPVRSPGPLVVSCTAVSPLPRRAAHRWRSVLCGTVPRVSPGGCYPPPCPVEPGPSSRTATEVARHAPRSPGQPIRSAESTPAASRRSNFSGATSTGTASSTRRSRVRTAARTRMDSGPYEIAAGRLASAGEGRGAQRGMGQRP